MKQPVRENSLRAQMKYHTITSLTRDKRLWILITLGFESQKMTKWYFFFYEHLGWGLSQRQKAIFGWNIGILTLRVFSKQANVFTQA